MKIDKGYIFYKSAGCGNWDKCHVIQIINENGYTMVVYKWFGKYKQWWHFKIEWYESVLRYQRKNPQRLQNRTKNLKSRKMK